MLFWFGNINDDVNMSLEDHLRFTVERIILHNLTGKRFLTYNKKLIEVYFSKIFLKNAIWIKRWTLLQSRIMKRYETSPLN